MRRLPLLLLILALAATSATAAFGLSFGRKNPALAIGLWPPTGDAYARAGNQLVTLAATSPDKASAAQLRSQAARLARKALLLEPTSVLAVRTLGVHLAERDRDAARRLMLLGAKLSRRNTGLNLWLSEDYARRGDDRNALRYFDVAMRTNSATANAILPVMATVLRRDGAPAAFETILADNPSWSDDFWTAVLSQAGDLSSAVDLRVRLHRRRVAMQPSHDALLIAYLAGAGRPADAFRLYDLTGLHEGRANGEILANPDFDAPSVFPPIEWKVASGENFASEIDAKHGRLLITTVGGASAVVAQQLAPIQNGRYRLEARFADKATAPLALRIACAEGAGERTLNLSVPFSESGYKEIGLASLCRYAWVSVELAGAGDAAGFDVALDRLSLRRID